MLPTLQCFWMSRAHDPQPQHTQALSLAVSRRGNSFFRPRFLQHFCRVSRLSTSLSRSHGHAHIAPTRTCNRDKNPLILQRGKRSQRQHSTSGRAWRCIPPDCVRRSTERQPKAVRNISTNIFPHHPARPDVPLSAICTRNACLPTFCAREPYTTATVPHASTARRATVET